MASAFGAYSTIRYFLGAEAAIMAVNEHSLWPGQAGWDIKVTLRNLSGGPGSVHVSFGASLLRPTGFSG